MFEPSWTLQIGERQHRGTGLLHKTLWPLTDDFDLFAVTINGTQIIVLPKEGKIMRNLIALWESAKGKLVWSRTMQLIIGGKWPERKCKCYGIGLDIGGKRIVYQLFEDGKLETG